MPIAFQWSGGKDSAHALGRLLLDHRYQVRCLVSTIDRAGSGSTVHGLAERLLRAQARAIGVPLHTVALAGPGLEDYTEVMGDAARRMRAAGIRAVAFGDLDHSGAFDHRVKLFGPAGLSVVEPLAGLTSPECMEDFLQSRIDARIVVVDAAVLGPDHLGAALDRAFVQALPAGCDPCGEFGEYHTFVPYAPYFRRAVTFVVEATECIERRIGTLDGIRSFSYWQLRLR